jgi:putative ABC transport system permease protein
MLWKQIKVAFRSLLHFKFLSILNIIGLAVGMSTAVLLVLYVKFELSYDRFHPGYDRMFRVTTRAESRDGQVLYVPSCLGYVPEELDKAGFSAVTSCRLFNNMIGARYRDRMKGTLRSLYADSTFFRVFGFKLLSGDPDSVLNQPNTAVLTESTAREYFNGENTLHQQIAFHDSLYTVTGIMEDVPLNSHLQFDLLVSFQTHEQWVDTRKRSLDYAVYLKAEPGVGADYLAELVRTIQEIQVEHYGTSGIYLESGLQKFRDIHLRSTDFTLTLGRPGDVRDLFILTSLAVFILVITLSNFISLMTSSNDLRIRDIGMRIVFGAERRQLLGQLVFESILIGLLAAFAAIVLFEINLGPFSRIMDTPVKLPVHTLLLLFILFICLAVLLGFLTGWLHFISVTRYAPVQMITGLSGHIKRGRLKAVLVLLQFGIMIFLFSVMSVLICQTRFMKQGDYGFERDNLYVFLVPNEDIRQDFTPVSGEISSLPGVVAVTASLGIPGDMPVVQNAWREGDVEDHAIMITEARARHDYPETYRLQLLEGAFFKGSSARDTGHFILNERACEALNLSNPVGTVIHVSDHRDTVVGVVRDFHYRSLRDRIDPLVISRYFRPYRHITVRTVSDPPGNLMQQVDSLLRQRLPGHDFIMFPLEKLHEQMYLDEDKQAMLYSGGALLAIVIGIFGLFALTTYATVRRTKEIGIRKAMGGNTADIFFLLGKSIMKWILAAAVMAAPLAWFAVEDWLRGFYYHIPNPWLLIILSILAAMTIALVAISYHLLRVTRVNPAESLRYE